MKSTLFYEKTSFSVLKLVFLLRNGLFHRKNPGISTSFSLQKLRFPLQNTISDVKYSFLRENLVFSVKTGIFYYDTVFSTEKTPEFLQVFLYKNWAFHCKILFQM